MSFSVVMDKPPPRKAPTPDAPMAGISPYGLRMPRQLKDTLEAVARENGRSLNSEIVARLEASVEINPSTNKTGFLSLTKKLATNSERSNPDLEARIAAIERALITLVAERAETDKAR